MRTRDMIRAARKDGRHAGLSAASWVFDGNTTDETYKTVLRGLEDGDPAVLDSFRVPNLSGEFAGETSSKTLADEYELTEDNDPDGWRLDAVCQAWEDAASAAFWGSIEREARFHLGAV
jgi:hypothetical protein